MFVRPLSQRYSLPGKLTCVEKSPNQVRLKPFDVRTSSGSALQLIRETLMGLKKPMDMATLMGMLIPMVMRPPGMRTPGMRTPGMHTHDPSQSC